MRSSVCKTTDIKKANITIQTLGLLVIAYVISLPLCWGKIDFIFPPLRTVVP